MKKMQTVSALMVAAAILLTGCTSNAPTTEDSPLVSTAQGLGEAKVKEDYFSRSQFAQVYDSTNGAISFERMDALDWKIDRILKAPEGEQLPAGDNFKATAQSNFSYNEMVWKWIDELKKDGWTATNEVKAQPRSDEDRYTGTKEDYRAKPYSVDLSKGKTIIKVKIENETITITINSQ
jgi:hypothetical protein